MGAKNFTIPTHFIPVPYPIPSWSISIPTYPLKTLSHPHTSPLKPIPTPVQTPVLIAWTAVFDSFRQQPFPYPRVQPPKFYPLPRDSHDVHTRPLNPRSVRIFSSPNRGCPHYRTRAKL